MSIAYRHHIHEYAFLQQLLLRLAKKWSAGINMDDALLAAQDCNAKGYKGILNYLGEDIADEERISRTVNEYSTLLERLYCNQIKGCISIKPSQLGLSIGYDLCLKNMKVIIASAKDFGLFVWIDMESSKYTDDTLAIYLKLVDYYRNNIGVVLQSTLRRTASDLLHLVEIGGKVRLVKGAYQEKEEIAFRSSADVSANFTKLLEILFHATSTSNTSNSSHGHPISQMEVNNSDTLRFAIATHDSRLIEYAIKLWKKSNQIDMANFEFQFLRGIRDELKKDLAEKGFRVAEYIPYGTEYLHYAIRRLKERRRNIFLLARSLAG
jgi:proline dehydrogenase